MLCSGACNALMMYQCFLFLTKEDKSKGLKDYVEALEEIFTAKQLQELKFLKTCFLIEVYILSSNDKLHTSQISLAALP